MALLLGGLTAVVATVTSSNQPAVVSKRNFYGILRVTAHTDRSGPRRELRHGRVLHGFQYAQEPQRTWPTTYFGPHSGVAMALNALDRPNRRVAIIGLGVGTMAAWGRAGDTFRFYEINPDVEEDRPHLVLVSKGLPGADRSRARRRARATRERAGPGPLAGFRHDRGRRLFKRCHSDPSAYRRMRASIYRRRLAPGGLLLLHISNRVLNLEPVARGLAQRLGWKSVLFVSLEDEQTGESQAEWVLVTDNDDFLKRSGLWQEAVKRSGEDSKAITWTDDFASLWHVLKF